MKQYVLVLLTQTSPVPTIPVKLIISCLRTNRFQKTEVNNLPCAQLTLRNSVSDFAVDRLVCCQGSGSETIDRLGRRVVSCEAHNSGRPAYQMGSAKRGSVIFRYWARLKFWEASSQDYDTRPKWKIWTSKKCTCNCTGYMSQFFVVN